MKKPENELKVGDEVWVKYDVEQVGKIEAITRSWDGSKCFQVRVYRGDYVMNREIGTVTDCGYEDLF